MTKNNLTELIRSIPEDNYSNFKGSGTVEDPYLIELITKENGKVFKLGGGSSSSGSGGSVGLNYVITPKITTPANNATNVSVLLTIIANGFKSIIPSEVRKHRIFQISKSDQFTDLVVNTPKNADELTITDPLDANTKYYLRVKDVTESFESEWSPIIMFTTGEAITVVSPTITINGDPDNIGVNPTFTGSEFSITNGQSDTHKSSTWRVSKVSDGSEVFKSENDTNNLTSITIDQKLEWSTKYEVSVVYNSTKYGSSSVAKKQFTTKAKPTEGNIGTPGQPGFGVSLCEDQERLTRLKLRLKPGADSPSSDDYGTYQHTEHTEHEMKYIAPFAVRIGDSSSPRYAKFGANCIDFKSYTDFDSEQDVESQGYMILPGFYNKGQVVGVFIGTYKTSVASDGKYVSAKGKTPVNNIQAHQLFTNCKNLGEGYIAATWQIQNIVNMISYIMMQYCTNTTNCAWYDNNGVMSYPKGNNNSGRDYNDSSVTHPDSSSPRTGMCTPLEKTTHNGQKNGICDVNGSFHEFAWGITSPTSGAALGTVFSLKKDVDHSLMTFDENGSNDAFGTESHLTKFYDKHTIEYNYSSSNKLGNGNNPVFIPTTNANKKLTGMIPLNNDSISSSGTNLFGSDYFYLRPDIASMVVYLRGDWSYTSDAGVGYADYYSRTHSSTSVGVRSAAYGN